MSEKIEALGLVLLLTAAVFVGHVLGEEAISFLAHVDVVLAIEIVVLYLVGGRRPNGK